MYVTILAVISSCTVIHHIRLCEAATAEDPRLGRLLFFGEIYGQQIRTGLNDMGKIILRTQKIMFNQSDFSGDILLTDGFLGMNLDINHLADKFHKEQVSPLPEGVVQGFRVLYVYLVKKISIVFDYTVQVATFGNISGTFKVVLGNQLFEATVNATKQDGGSCVVVDGGLNTTLDNKNYHFEFSVTEGGLDEEGLVFKAMKVINTFMIQTFLKRIYEQVRATLINLSETPEQTSGVNFHKQMELALCPFIN